MKINLLGIAKISSFELARGTFPPRLDWSCCCLSSSGIHIVILIYSQPIVQLIPKLKKERP